MDRSCWRDAPRPSRTRSISGQLLTVRARLGQEFLVTRDVLLRRDARAWRQLRELLMRPVCHEGGARADLHARAPAIAQPAWAPDNWTNPEEWRPHEYRRMDNLITGSMMEHLAHVIYGHKDLAGDDDWSAEMCRAFDCSHANCERAVGALRGYQAGRFGRRWSGRWVVRVGSQPRTQRRRSTSHPGARQVMLCLARPPGPPHPIPADICSWSP